MIKQYRVREGNTGILYLTDSEGKEERYIPDYDLDKARELLLEFQELKDGDGKCLKDNYWMDGHNWYPTMVSYLYWQVFFRYVKYKPLLEQVIDGNISFQFQNKADLHDLVTIIENREQAHKLKMTIFRTLVRFNNWLTLRLYPVELMFFRFSINDFRSVEIRKTLDELGTSYIEVLPPPRFVEVLRNFFQSRPYYFYGGLPSKNFFNYKYDLSKLSKHKRFVFEKAIEKTEWMISGYNQEYKRHLKHLKNHKFKTFYGFDDSNGYVFPILYACQRNGIKTIGHQHGAYVRRHAGYIMEGISKEDYKWFDKVIVWGEYWKEHLLKISSVYSPDMLVVGSNKVKWDYGLEKNSNAIPRNILLPYEFTTNTFKIGKYVSKLVDLGYNIFFKPRKDERLEDQLATYCLAPEYLEKLHIANEINADFMKKIDIIMGTMTTLVYELLPYNKIIWILETEYKHLEDLVEEGYAHKIKYDDLENLGHQYFTKTQIQSNYFFNPETLSNTLRKHVIQ